MVIRNLSLLTFASNFFLLLVFLSFFWNKLGKGKDTSWKPILDKFRGKETVFSLIVSITATLGSLYFSEVADFTPCKLCWYQRIFMYPLPFIFASALIKKTKEVWNFVLPLSIVGAIIAAYHYYLQINPDALAPCSAIGFSVSCSDRFITYFGYITIPWMSLSAFLLISFFMLILKNNKN